MRRAHKLKSALFVASVTATLLASLLAAPASAFGSPQCGPANGVQVCVTIPSATLSGTVVVVATAVPSSGPVQFNWIPNGTCLPSAPGTCALVQQFGRNPVGPANDYSFAWPTQKFLDGSGTLQALVPDSSATPVFNVAVSISGITLSNGNTSAIQAQNLAPTDWMSFLPPQTWSGSQDPVVAAVGDGADDQDLGNSVANSIATSNNGGMPPLFLYLGDVYENGTSTEMLNHYGWNAMDTVDGQPCALSDCASLATWGALGAITQPTIGNHELKPANPVTDGSLWSDYWHGRPLVTHFIFANTLFLDLNCGPSAGECDFAQGSDQYNTVSTILSAPHPPCVISYWHIPAVSHDLTQGRPTIQPMWSLLVHNGGTVVLNGHVHHSEVYKPMNDQYQLPTSQSEPAMTELIAGTGGHGISKVSGPVDPRLDWSNGGKASAGALYLTLNGAANGGTPTSITYTFEGLDHSVLHRGPPIPCGTSPQITSFAPSQGTAGAPVTLSGTQFSSATAVTFNGTSATFSISNDTTIATSVPAGASTGPICVTISGSPFCSSSSFVVPQPPVVNGFSPSSGSPGTPVTINGAHFSGASSVTFNGTAASVSFTNDSTISTSVPSGATTGKICVTVASMTGCSSTNFTVTPPTGINRIGVIGTQQNPPGGASQLSVIVGPGGVPAGDTVVVAIAAQNSVTISSVSDNKGNTYTRSVLNPYAGTGKCTTALYASTLSTSLVSGDTITVSIPGGSAWGFIAEDWSGLIAPNANGTASSGTATTAISISTTGSTTSPNEAVFGVACIAGNSTVTGDPNYVSDPALKNVNSPTTRILALESRIVTTTGTQTATYTLGTAQAWSGLVGTYSGSGPPAVPAVTGFNPGSGSAGTSVTVTGSNFTGATAVTFHGTSDPTYHVDSDTQITAHVPNGAATGPICVSVGSSMGCSSSNFTVQPSPQVASFNPSSGTSGTSVTVTGTGFTGASSVTFNGTSASFTPGSDTQLTAAVPSSATTGPICVTVGSSTGCSPSSFTVIQQPTVTGFNPTSGTPGTSVTLTGSHFTGASGVTFNGLAASFSFTNDTTISTSVPSGATDGVICVTNTAGTGCSASSFDVTAGSGLAFVQASGGATGTSSSVAPSWPATTGSGTGVLLVATLSVNTGATTGTFSAPSGWTLAAQSAVASGSHTAVFYIANPASGRSGLETFTYSKTGRSIYGALMEYNGFSAAAGVDKIATSNGTGTSPSTGTTATDTAAAEVLVGAIGNRNVSTSSGQAQGGSATCGTVSERAEAFVGSGGTGLAGRAIDCVQTSTGTVEFHSTLSGSQPWTGVIVTFK